MLDPKTAIGMVSLKVADLDAQIEFYRQVIGLSVLDEENGRVVLGAGERALVELIAQPDGQKLNHATGLYHLAIRVPNRADLGAWLVHYSELDGPYWQGASDHEVSEALYLSDPEGNGIEIYTDRPKSEWTFLEGGGIRLVTEPLDLPSLVNAAHNQAWEGMPDGTDLGHIHLQVSDIAESNAFYTGLLGFDLKLAFYDSALFIAAGDYHHHIGLNTWQSKGAPAPPSDALGLEEFEILCVDAGEIESVRQSLAAADYPFQTENGNLTVADPSGNRMRLIVGE